MITLQNLGRVLALPPSLPSIRWSPTVLALAILSPVSITIEVKRQLGLLNGRIPNTIPVKGRVALFGLGIPKAEVAIEGDGFPKQTTITGANGEYALDLAPSFVSGYLDYSKLLDKKVTARVLIAGRQLAAIEETLIWRFGAMSFYTMLGYDMSWRLLIDSVELAKGPAQFRYWTPIPFFYVIGKKEIVPGRLEFMNDGEKYINAYFWVNGEWKTLYEYRGPGSALDFAVPE